MAQAKYRTEDVASTPRGWRVRTTTAGPHMVRIAFPPGTRRKGSGRVVQILHPKGENPQCNPAKKEKFRTEWGVALDDPSGLSYKEKLWFRSPGPAERKAAALRRRGFKDAEAVKVRVPNPLLESILGGAAAGTAVVAVQELIKRRKGKKQGKNPKRGLSVPEKHQIKIAKQTLRMPDPMLGVMGGMTKKQAREILRKHGIRFKENPNGNGAAELFRDFHGRGPKKVLELQESSLAAGSYAALGDMGGLWLDPVNGDPGKWPLPSIEFEKRDGVKLAASPDNTQLYLIGGNQAIPLDDLRALGLDTSKQLIPVGLVFAISYVTEKKFDGFKTSEYAHRFGEETGEIPMAFYDRQAKRIALVGGAYSIAPPSKKLGASPGIVN